jgi:[acyl-carrier-protein] S-malonyltransferase
MSSVSEHVHAAAWLGDAPVLTTEVDAHLDRLRAGPRAALLPVAHSPEGRQLRRWATQVVVTRRLLEVEAAALGHGDAPPVVAIVPDRQAALELGGIAANVLAHSGPARTVFAEVTRSVQASSQDVAAYYARNLDEFPDEAGRPRALEYVADDIGRSLTASLRRRCFVEWLDQRRATLVRLEPGHEHPGDPRQPDATHRH